MKTCKKETTVVVKDMIEMMEFLIKPDEPERNIVRRSHIECYNNGVIEAITAAQIIAEKHGIHHE